MASKSRAQMSTSGTTTAVSKPLAAAASLLTRPGPPPADLTMSQPPSQSLVVQLSQSSPEPPFILVPASISSSPMADVYSPKAPSPRPFVLPSPPARESVGAV